MKTKKKQTKGIKFSETEFYFDDCAICQAMKKAEEEGRNLDASELKEAFGKAKRQRAVVGGAVFVEEGKNN